jgi:N,N'-diacetyllegionaminate synthase
VTERAYILAELGSTHDGSLGNCVRLATHCARAGADAIKLQCHQGERTKGQPPWFADVLGESREDYLIRTGFDESQWRIIRSTCTGLGVDLVVSPFSVEAVDLLETLPVDAYKVASGQITNRPMLDRIRQTGRDVYLSSGMTTTRETGDALATLEIANHGEVHLLQCSSEYPCKPEHVGINIITEWQRRFQRPVGFSDHTCDAGGESHVAAVMAYQAGARVIEKHCGFHRGQAGTDAPHSLTPEEFAQYVRAIRQAETITANRVDKDALAHDLGAMREAFLERPVKRPF